MKLVIDLDTKKLLQKLQKLPTEVQDKVVKKAVRDGAKAIQKEAKRTVPVDTGLMKKSIKVKQAKKKYSEGFLLIVKVEDKKHHLIELGTKDRKPQKAKKLAFEVNGKMIYVDKVTGLKPTPYLGTAYEKNKDNVIKQFKATLNNYINKMNQ
ncbi:HK97 gp10 family phage protein [Litoribacter alkaliphilus]|uniref:HK97 gp10 family phage protein n=1 Tax=Litoribacter ruber TaxID=702568 RepID=A0AAP2CLH4_9BACT|nr:HK97-gp10 family putative phage morphogenesis protein [Litoribacter alkaliphilus]MBS9525914.1 HK97 gp10 family phage protein [Litoribacter alkaliphilus]